MFYNSFLVLLSQLAFQQVGKISLYGCEIRVKSFPHTKRWELSADIASSTLPSHVRECLRSGRKLPLESSDSYLQKTQEAVTFVQTVPSPKQYLQYKLCMENFFEGLSLWIDLKQPH